MFFGQLAVICSLSFQSTTATEHQLSKLGKYEYCSYFAMHGLCRSVLY